MTEKRTFHDPALPTTGAEPDRQFMGMYDAQVAVSTDPLGQGRVQLFVPQVLGQSMSNWAAPMQPGLTVTTGQSVQCLFLGGNPVLPQFFVGITSTDIQTLSKYNKSGVVLNNNPYFTGNSTTGWTASGGSATAVTSPTDTNPPFSNGIQVTSSGTGGSTIAGSNAPFTITGGQAYTVSAWVYYPVGGSVAIGLGSQDSDNNLLPNITQTFTVPAGTWTSLTATVTAPANAASAWPVIGPTTSTPGQLFTAQAVTAVGNIQGSILSNNTVTAQQLAVGNLNLNPYFAGGNTFAWTASECTLTATNVLPGSPPYPFAGEVVINTVNNFIQQAPLSPIPVGSPGPFGVVFNQPYQMSVWVYCANSMTINYGFGWANSGGTIIGTATASATPSTDVWVNLSTVQDAPASAAFGFVYISSSASSGTYYVAEALVSLQVQGGSVAPGTITGTQIQAGTVVAQIVDGTTITGAQFIATGTSGDILMYSGQPAAGNLIMSASPTTGTDAFGNTFNKVLQIGNSSTNQMFAVDNMNTTFDITTIVSGILQAIWQFSTTDMNQDFLGLLGSILLSVSSGSFAQSSIWSTGFSESLPGGAIVMQAEADDSSVAPYVTFGTVTSPDDVTLVFAPIACVTPFAFVLYSASSTQTTVTYTSGSGHWTAPSGVTSIKAQCWGGGGGGGGANAGNGGGSGGGGGEYASEATLAVTPTHNYSYAVGSGGPKTVNGGNTTMAGDSVTVTAHGGAGTNSVSAGGAGGTGSANTTHFNGGTGGDNPTGHNYGGGGGAAGGSNGAGINGSNSTSSAPGNGGTGLGGGGGGGRGGSGSSNGQTGASPGGAGGGGGGTGSSAAGANGMVKLSYTTGVAPTVLFSVATTGFTDQFGTAIPTGLNMTGNAAISGTLSAGATTLSSASVTNDTSTSTLHVNGVQVKTHVGTVSPSPPGGGPLSYTPSYESQMSACLSDVISKLQTAGILS